MRELFEHNRLVDNSYIRRHVDPKAIGKYGDYWLYSFWAIPMLNDLRSRSLEFTTPWLNHTHPAYMQLPKFEYTNKSLSDILDERAVALHQQATRDNKQVWIMWSGGIDSTTMLTAFIKNVPESEINRYSIVMSANSIAENFYFYQKYIHNRFRLINWLELDLNQELLENTIVLHGDPANALLSCPTVSVFAPLVESGKHLLPFRENVGTIIDTLEAFVTKSRGEVKAGWAEWYINKLADAIPKYDQATSIATFWWWNYVNFKWHGSILRPFFFTRSSTNKPISEQEFRYYYDTCFYINDDLQNWSYSNIDRIVQTPFDYKPLMRDYIYDLNKDTLYQKYKGFKASRRTNLNQAQQVADDMPMVYDQHWVGHPKSNRLMETVIELLNEFKG